MRDTVLSAALCSIALALPAAAQDQGKQKKVGYTDTPVIPGQKWRVHDADRPRPKVVTPGNHGKPPSDAVVLFDGTNLDAWSSMRKRKNGDDKAHWKVEDGYMEVVRGGAIKTRQAFGDCQLHIEWQAPAVVKGDSQGRGNSGVFLMNRYEIQVLDSFDNPTYADGQAGALYGQWPPLVNASRKPGEWQTYDIIFTAPRFAEDGKLLSPAYATVLHNGVLLHNHRALIGGTTHRKVAQYSKHPPKDSIQLQDHGNPTRFRNIWVRPLDGAQAEDAASKKDRGL